MSKDFWIKNPNILFKDYDLWPISSMNKVEKFNAISRLIILLTIVGYTISFSIPLLISGFITLGIIIFLFNLKEPIKENFKVNKVNEKKSTPINPLGNVQLPEIQFNPKRPSAPPSYSKEQDAQITKNTKQMVMDTSFPNDPDLKAKLFKDLGDEMDLNRSMRNFYTTANSQIPNDQNAFAQYCYGNMPSCKEGNALACEKQAFKYIPS